MASKQRRAPSKSEASLQIKIPKKVKRALSMKAASEGVTLRVIVLRALDSFGIEVPDKELIDRRKFR